MKFTITGITNRQLFVKDVVPGQIFSTEMFPDTYYLAIKTCDSERYGELLRVLNGGGTELGLIVASLSNLGMIGWQALNIPITGVYELTDGVLNRIK